jgi:ABC-2 type transport system ATP-binding protein
LVGDGNMTPPAIQLESLSKYYGRVQAVRNVSLTVEAGQVYGFLGPNGAGKSTTIRMLLGLVRPTTGHAFLLGRPCRSVQARAAGVVGALVEDPAFYGYLSARRNLALLARLSGGVPSLEIERVLDLVGLRDQARRRVSAFSHGMKQRLAVAQALLPRPRVLLLDEPTNGLDPRGRVEMRVLLQRLNREGVTIFLSSHLLEEVERLCTHLAFLSRGRLLAAGPTADLLASEVVRVEVEARPAEVAERVLATRAEVEGLLCQGETLTFSCPRPALAAINTALVAAGVAVSALVPRAESLEELYLRLTEETPTDAPGA